MQAGEVIELLKFAVIGLAIGSAVLLAWAGVSIVKVIERRESISYRRGWEAAKREEQLQRSNAIIDKQRGQR